MTSGDRYASSIAFSRIRLIKVIYCDDAEDSQRLASHFDLRFGLSANGVAVLLGLFPGSLMTLCSRVIG